METGRLRSPLSKVRGLGSAKDGTEHWWLQRLTALTLIPLALWFVYSMMWVAVGADSEALQQWIKSPFVAIALVILFIALSVHARLGLQVVIEDYVHHHGRRIGLLILNKLVMFFLMVISIIAVLKIHLI
jgi:succinate dehydrogenase / fumarate reductase membrane anchor subunit